MRYQDGVPLYPPSSNDSRHANIELLTAERDRYKAHIEWMAQTVHQSYHPDKPGTWRNCTRDICSSTVYLFEERPEPRKKA